MKTLESIDIQGVLAGVIWMPSCHAWKHFNVKFTPEARPFSREWDGMRDALLHITNDGDFQSCGLAEAWLTATYRDGDNRRVVIGKEINLDAKLISDFKAKPETIDAYFDGALYED